MALHACIFKNTKKNLHFQQNFIISVTRNNTFCIWKNNFFFQNFFFEFLKIPFSEHNSARFDEKIFFENFKKKFSKKNYIFKCRMCHFWSLKLWNFVENANAFLYSWRYRHVMSKLFSFSIISRRFKFLTSSSDTVYVLYISSTFKIRCFVLPTVFSY